MSLILVRRAYYAANGLRVFSFTVELEGLALQPM